MESSRPALVHLATGVLLLVLVSFTAGCESSPEILTNSELDSLNKLRSGQYALVSNQELATLRQEAEVGKSVGRYQIHREGFRTWRLDTTDGQVCLLLTSQEDWKKPDTEAQSCALN
jgi:hypothetical protein